MNFTPEQQQMMMALQAAVAGAKEGSFDLPDGTRMIVEKPDTPGVKAVLRSSSGNGMLVTVYDELDQRPDGYPSAMPFLRGLACAAGEEPGGKTFATWFGLKDLDAAFAQVESESLNAGWTRSGDAPSGGMFGMREVTYTMPGSKRQIMGAAFGPLGFLSCTDESAP